MTEYQVLFESVICKNHLRNGLQINEKTFQIFCKNCLTEGILNNENLKFLGNSNKKTEKNKFEEKEIIFCYRHINEEAIFYCDDCFEFICKSCFATDHRNHNSSTFDLISKNIKDGLIKTFDELNLIKKSIDENLVSINEFNNYFISHKNTFKSQIQEINDRVMKNINIKVKEFSEELDKIFNGIDFEVENSTLRLENTKKKAAKMINEFEKLHKEIESIKSYKKICMLKKEKDSQVNENIKFVADIEFFLNHNLEKTKNKSKQEMENFLKKCAKFERNAEIYEKSVINTIVSGIPNICNRVRRFNRYFFSNTKYFKTSSVCMLTSHTINLVGFSLCGIFNSKSNSLNEGKLNNLKLQIKIFEMETVKQFDSNASAICSIEIQIPVIINVVDPVYQFYLNKSVTINKDKFYYIFINNISENNYVDIWTGEVMKDFIKTGENQHSVICNNSAVKFNFINAIGVESDLNEFTGGMLSDLIFSHVDY